MDQGKTKDNLNLPELRCSCCKKLLARSGKENVAYEIKCNRCGTLNSVFKGITDQVIITDPEGIILYANNLVESITGFSLAEVLGKKPSLWGGQMSKEFYKEMWDVVRLEKKPIEVNLINKKKDGTLYKAKLHISPVFGEEKEIKMFVGIESVIEDKKNY